MLYKSRRYYLIVENSSIIKFINYTTSLEKERNEEETQEGFGRSTSRVICANAVIIWNLEHSLGILLISSFKV